MLCFGICVRFNIDYLELYNTLVDIVHFLYYNSFWIMKPIRYNKEKDAFLKKERKISFQEIANLIEKGKIIDIINHPNKKRYQKQKMFLVNWNNYVIMVPFVEENEFIFLKTIFPSRKYTKKYLKKK